MSNGKPIRRRRTMRDFGMDEDTEMNPRDMETMSMAACLNRIMIKVNVITIMKRPWSH